MRTFPLFDHGLGLGERKTLHGLVAWPPRPLLHGTEAKLDQHPAREGVTLLAGCFASPGNSIYCEEHRSGVRVKAERARRWLWTDFLQLTPFSCCREASEHRKTKLERPDSHVRSGSQIGRQESLQQPGPLGKWTMGLM